MADIILSKTDFRDKVYACWLGKNIGGTLGEADECKKYTLSLTFYDPYPDGASPNDDLDLQLIWLVMMEKEGIPPRPAHFGDYWRKYLYKYPWNEYGFCSRNLARGLAPPVSGWFENFYVDDMGSPIRSEIWAVVAPGDPQRAAALAWRDSAVDHAGGEGTWGEMFWAAVESAAFVIDDPQELIRIGLAMIPSACNISRAIREVLWCRKNGIRYDDARERLTRLYWNEQPCNAIPNHAFTIIGWLYGEDFGDMLCKAVNCGFDTDCTAATLGALLGILGGTAAIPAKWSEPVGTNIVIHEFTTDCGVPKTLGELTDRTVALAEKFAALPDANVSFGPADDLPADLLGRLHRNEAAFAAMGQDIRCGTALCGEVEIALHYNGDPVLYPEVARRMQVTCKKGEQPVAAEVLLQSPDGWAISPVADSDPPGFDVLAETIEKAGRLQVAATIDGQTHEVEFTVLSPAEALGYPNAKQADEWTPGAKPLCISPRRPELRFETK